MKQYRHFSVAEWLFYLEHLPQHEIQLGLTRIKKVAASLQLLQPKAKVISVAGTNGKGSTVAALEAIYLAEGYDVATYTSPHLLSFNERIKVNQKVIKDEELAEAFCVVEEAREKEGIHLTYFEIATLAALWHFQRHSIDVLILEVGLGGRLDATNIIDADLAIITTIDFDHQAFLGDTKEAIGYEKAGILRPKKPLIYADINPTNSILAVAASLNCPTYISHQDYKYAPVEGIFHVINEHETITDLPQPVLHPNSIGAAIMTCLCLRKSLPINFSSIREALGHLFLPGRLQLIKGEKSTLFDVSHNPQGVSYLAAHIKRLSWQGSIHVVFSALRDKNIPELIAPLIDHVHHWYLALLTSKRAASREQFNTAFRIYDIVPFYYDNPRLAYQAACNTANAGDLIVVYGSFLTVGEVLPAVYNSTRTGER
ncbi:folylpolyglutamate synthase [Legionella lansingensis]|uniref:Dihydrofolate synthase/folylpolyglutamate synthase n=1 Tax=Legionella lansingensis TaxID=45067 RepID=A0A0W0VK00_9GAMM|nr:bifunctional tetrahydrofolate synthase/dihydrofolate synthase [Legionella lansingensis]KTD20439.1 bifunctional protein FolC [Legionella lansingensis]SNV49947.1 folylpolyglutamate synthase [Legionella lansingensis]